MSDQLERAANDEESVIAAVSNVDRTASPKSERGGCDVSSQRRWQCSRIPPRRRFELAVLVGYVGSGRFHAAALEGLTAHRIDLGQSLVGPLSACESGQFCAITDAQFAPGGQIDQPVSLQSGQMTTDCFDRESEYIGNLLSRER